jgi:dimethylglycine dehydrogenase
MAGMLDVYNALMATSCSAEIVHIGSATLNSVRMEKAYRSGSEITNEVTINEADVRLFSRDSGFQGAEISLQPATRWVLAYLQLDEPAQDSVLCDPLGSESVWYRGKPVGQISSGGYGYDRGRFLAFAYIRPELNMVGNEFEVLVMGEPRRACHSGLRAGILRERLCPRKRESTPALITQYPCLGRRDLDCLHRFCIQ